MHRQHTSIVMIQDTLFTGHLAPYGRTHSPHTPVPWQDGPSHDSWAWSWAWYCTWAARHGAVQGEFRHGGRGCGPKTGAKRVGGGDRQARRIRRRIKRCPWHGRRRAIHASHGCRRIVRRLRCHSRHARCRCHVLHSRRRTLRRHRRARQRARPALHAAGAPLMTFRAVVPRHGHAAARIGPVIRAQTKTPPVRPATRSGRACRLARR